MHLFLFVCLMGGAVCGNLKATVLSAGLVRTWHESLFTMVPKVGNVILAYRAGLCPTVLLSQKVLRRSGQSHIPNCP